MEGISLWPCFISIFAWCGSAWNCWHYLHPSWLENPAPGRISWSLKYPSLGSRKIRLLKAGSLTRCILKDPAPGAIPDSLEDSARGRIPDPLTWGSCSRQDHRLTRGSCSRQDHMVTRKSCSRLDPWLTRWFFSKQVQLDSPQIYSCSQTTGFLWWQATSCSFTPSLKQSEWRNTSAD